MKSSLKFLAAICAACFLTLFAFAADAAPAASPAGTWKWTPPGRGGNPGVERTLKLDYAGGNLTGTMLGAKMGQFEVPDAAIADGAFKDGTVSFTVTTEVNGNKRTTKYEGKVDGDTIKGSSEAPGRDGAVQKRDWTATRAK
ncbi:MAG: hypothetical protein JWQ62_1117 [Lacunisphaera sp.]|nr:hypothetical protein [Lacunisphaera sp.]